MNASRPKLDTQMMSDALSCIFLAPSLFTKSSTLRSLPSKIGSLILTRYEFHFRQTSEAKVASRLGDMFLGCFGFYSY